MKQTKKVAIIVKSIFFGVIDIAGVLVTVLGGSKVKILGISLIIGASGFVGIWLLLNIMLFLQSKSEINCHRDVYSDLEEIKKVLSDNSELDTKNVLNDLLEKLLESANTEEIKNIIGPLEDNSDQYFKRIIKILEKKSSFEYFTTDVTQKLKHLLDENSSQIKEIHIICFGRSGYGEIVQHINDKRLPIKVKIIMCNPVKNAFICNPDDDTKIRNHIKNMIENGGEVYVSSIPPAIRASTVYLKDKVAIWSAVQSYQFNRMDNNRLELTRPSHSLIVTCNEDTIKRDFDGIVKCFENEYERLIKSSVQPYISEEGSVVFD